MRYSDQMEQTYIIKAGEAFGSAGHPSTALALWMLANLAESDFAPQRVLDIGCGSGVLSVAGALTWPQAQVIASDIAPEAVAQTRANAEENGVAERVKVLRADGCRHPEIAANAPYPIILANILTDVHIRLARDYARLLAPGGRLLLSGILQWRVPELLAYLTPLGLRVEQQAQEEGWVALLMKKK